VIYLIISSASNWMELGTSRPSCCPSGSSLVLDCANDRCEYCPASASGNHL